MRVVALVLVQAVAAAQETVEFVDKQIEGFVGVFAGNAGDQVRAGNLDVP